MTTLSVFKKGFKAPVVAASPLYLLPALSPSDAIVFEVLAVDAASLKHRVGTPELYYLDDRGPFRGVVEALEVAEPVHPTMIALRRPVMRGLIRRLGVETETKKLQ